MTTRRRPAPFALATFALGAILLHARAVLGDDDDQLPPPSPPPRRRRASFPLRASPGDAAGTVSLVWTPPDTPRVLPADDAASDADPSVVPPGLAAFKAAARDASAGARFDIFAGACVEGDPRRDGFDARLHAYAPPIAPCAPATTLVAEASDTNTAVVDGLTPGATYAFRVAVQSKGEKEKEEDEEEEEEDVTADADEEAWSAAATATATLDDDDAPVDENLTLDDPELGFCAAAFGSFPAGAILLDGSEIFAESASGCCLECSRTLGCNAWAHCGDDDDGDDDDDDASACAAAGARGQCWLMNVSPSEAATTEKDDSSEDDSSEDDSSEDDSSEDDSSEDDRKDHRRDEDANATRPLQIPGWTGGVIDASRGPTRPRAPVSLVLNLGKDDDGGKEKNASWCASWADPPALPSVAAASSATATFTVTVAVAGRESTYDMAGTLPPRLCACEGWAPPGESPPGESPPGESPPGESPPGAASSSNAEADAFRSVTVSVVAENPGGSSSAASESVDLSRSDLDAWRAASRIPCAVASPDDDVEEPPPGPPRDVRARWVVDDGGSSYVAIDWRPPLDAAGEDALETDGPVGYQVTWTQWDPSSFPAVDRPMSVVLADDERVRRVASSPCGSGNVENGDGSSARSCFFAGLATGLRLDGLDGSLALAIAVRAITTGGPGPLSAPVVTSPAPTVEDEGKEPPGDSPTGDSPTGDSPPGDSPPGDSPTGDSPTGDASSVDGTVPPEAPRPVSPALDPPSVPAVVRLPLYEANRVGGVYEQMNNDNNGQGSGTAAFDAGGDFVEESTTEEVVGGGGFGGLGYGAYGGGFGYPFAGLGLGGLGLGAYRDGFYGGGGGGNGTSVVVGGSTVTVILNVNENTTSTEDASTTPTPVPSPSPTPSPVPSPTPSPVPSPTPSPVPSPVPSPSPLVPELRKRGTKENPLPGEEKTVARVRVGSEPSAPGSEPAVVKIGDARNAPAPARETHETSATSSSAKPRTPGSDVKVVPLDAKAREPPAAVVTTPTPSVIPLPADAGPRDSEAPAVVTLTEREKAKAAAAAGKTTRVRGEPDADAGAETKPGRDTKPGRNTKPRSSPEKEQKPKPTPEKVSEARAVANQRSSRGGGRKAGERGARQVSAQARKP